MIEFFEVLSLVVLPSIIVFMAVYTFYKMYNTKVQLKITILNDFERSRDKLPPERKSRFCCLDSTGEVGSSHLKGKDNSGFFVTGMFEGNLFYFVADYCPFCGEKYPDSINPKD